MKITFTINSLETAPKDRRIMLWCPRRRVWLKGIWDEQPYNKKPRPYWRTENCRYTDDDRTDQPTYWTETEDMAVL